MHTPIITILKKHLPLALLTGLSIYMCISLIVMAYLNRPIADDVSYFRYFETSDIGTFLHWHYFVHTGRLLQSLLVSVGYIVAGEQSVKLMPFFLFFLLTAVLSWASHLFIPWKKKTLSLTVVSGLTLSSISILFMPSVYDSYLWWTSSSIYLASIISAVFTVCYTYTLLKKKIPLSIQILALTGIALGQTLSEITSVILIGSIGLLLGYYALQRDREKILVCIKVVGALLIGFLLTYLSPGSMARRSSEDGGQIGFDFVRIFVLSTRHLFELIASISLWEIALLLLIGLSLSQLIRPVSVKDARKFSVIIIACMVVGIYGSFCINNYVWAIMPYRALTLPGFIMTLSLIALFTITFSTLLNRLKKWRFVDTAIVISFIILSIPAVLGLTRSTLSTIVFMDIRDTAHPAREVNIKNQLESNAANIQVESLPILVKSQAIDLIYGAEKQVDWYEHAIKGHNNIPHTTPIHVVAPPNDYCIFGGQESTDCSNLGDYTTFRKVINKINTFMVYYFSTGY